LSESNYKGPDQTDFYPIRKMRVFAKGLHVAALTNTAVAYKIVVALIALTLGWFFRDWTDLAVILIATAVILETELMNSALEGICDYIQPEEDPRIGKIKDMAAAGAGIAMLVWVVVMVYEFGHIAYHIKYGS
jgi:diacylglycerol kinase